MNAQSAAVERARAQYLAAHARFVATEQSFEAEFGQRRRTVLADVPKRQDALRQDARVRRSEVLGEVLSFTDRVESARTLRARAPWGDDIAWESVWAWAKNPVLPNEEEGDLPETRFNMPDTLDATLLRVGALRGVGAPALLPNPARANVSLLASHQVATRVAEILLVRMLATTANVQVHVIDTHNTGRSLPAFGVANQEKEGVFERPCATETEAKMVVESLMGRVREVSSNVLQGRYRSLLEYNASAPKNLEAVHVLVAFDVETYSPQLLEGIEKLSRATDQGVFLLAHCGDGSRISGHDELGSILRSGVETTQGPDGTLRIAGFPVELGEGVPNALVAATLRWAEDYKAFGQTVVQLVDLLSTSWSLAGDYLNAVVGTVGGEDFTLSLGVTGDPHMLVVGESGSGKSTFLHSFILALATAHSPEELNFFLLDGKEGVEMVTYAPSVNSLTFLPHVKVAAVKSDVEMCLSVLRRLTQEIKERNERFKEHGVTDILSFNKDSGERMPRLVTVIDEFQVLFAKSKHVEEIGQLMSDIAKKGRSSGIHLVLATQSLKGLAGSNGLPGTLEQITNRVALSCDVSSSEAVLGPGNTAAAKLSRKGEAIYNKGGKDPELNKRFQVGYVEPGPRARIVEDLYHRASDVTPPVVLQGGESVSVTQAGLLKLLESAPLDPVLCLGGPLTLRGPVQPAFPLDYRHHLLVLGSDDPTGMLVASTLALAASRPEARFVVCESKTRGSSAATFERLRDVLSAAGRDVVWAAGVEAGGRSDVISELSKEVLAASKARGRVNDGRGVYVIVPGAQGLPPKLFKDILDKGFEVGVQVLVHAQDISLVKDVAGTSIASAKSVEPFGMRVLTSLDSASKSRNILGEVISKHPNIEVGRNTLDTLAIDNESFPFIPVDPPTAAEWRRIAALLEKK